MLSPKLQAFPFRDANAGGEVRNPFFSRADSPDFCGGDESGVQCEFVVIGHAELNRFDFEILKPTRVGENRYEFRFQVSAK